MVKRKRQEQTQEVYMFHRNKEENNMTDKTTKIIDHINDFGIRIRPVMDGDKWTGELMFALLADNKNTLDPIIMEQIIYIQHLMCSSYYVMRNDPLIYKQLEEFAIQLSEVASKYKSEPEVTKREDNVVHIDFKTKTKELA